MNEIEAFAAHFPHLFVVELLPSISLIKRGNLCQSSDFVRSGDVYLQKMLLRSSVTSWGYFTASDGRGSRLRKTAGVTVRASPAMVGFPKDVLQESSVAVKLLWRLSFRMCATKFQNIAISTISFIFMFLLLLLLGEGGTYACGSSDTFLFPVHDTRWGKWGLTTSQKQFPLFFRSEMLAYNTVWILPCACPHARNEIMSEQ